MNKSSAKRSETTGSALPNSESLEFDLDSSREPNLDSSAAIREFPSFSAYSSSGFAQTAKFAGRLNAAAVSEDELEDLLAERKGLIAKKMNGTATQRELNRLEYVRWNLDRIEDAKHGLALDLLEAHVEQYESFSDRLERLIEKLDSFRGRRDGRR